MNRLRSLAAGASTLLVASRAAACACGVAGLDTALTTSMDRWGARASESARLASGHLDAHGRYRPLATDERDTRYDAQLLLAYRPVLRLELSALFGYARMSSAEGSTRVSSSGLADTWARLRFDAWDETPAHRPGLPLPVVAFSAALRAPSARGNGSTGVGLGTWEGAAGVSLERSLSARLRLGASGEAALRATDSTLGVERTLGPRLSAQLSGWYWPEPSVVLSATSNLTWEGEVTVDSQTQRGTAGRSLQVGAGITYALPASSLRPSVAVRQMLPIEGLGMNALIATTAELSLAFID